MLFGLGAGSGSGSSYIYYFSYTDNLYPTLQKREFSATTGKKLVSQTVETLKLIRNDKSFDALYDSVLEKKKAFNGNIDYPILKWKTQAPGRYSLGKDPDEYPTTARDNYRKVYFEALDLLISHIEQRFQQPSFEIFKQIQSLVLDSLIHEIESLEGEINYVNKSTRISTLCVCRHS